MPLLPQQVARWDSTTLVVACMHAVQPLLKCRYPYTRNQFAPSIACLSMEELEPEVWEQKLCKKIVNYTFKSSTSSLGTYCVSQSSHMSGSSTWFHLISATVFILLNISVAMCV